MVALLLDDAHGFAYVLLFVVAVVEDMGRLGIGYFNKGDGTNVF